MLRDIDSLDSHSNLAALKRNVYPGRGLVAGIDKSGKHLVQICWIMGRSPNSRNRVYKRDGGRVYTDLARSDPTADTKLTIYNAMDEARQDFVASNGDQTDTALKGLQGGVSFIGALNQRTYEPDAPHYTPRITALCTIHPGPHIIISALRKESAGMGCLHTYYTHDARIPGTWENGTGWCITTYEGDGNPLPSFQGEPYVVPLRGDIKEVAKTFWGVLNEQNRVALAAKFIDCQTGKSEVEIINKF